jgi:[ribosomal protein S5]-alanine N-acetyltransferase
VVSHVVQYGFEHLGLVKITAGFYESNKGSKKVLLKVGFEVEGFRKKQVMLGNQREGIYILGIIKK